MPVLLDVKGLLPGRGPAGRGPGRAAGLAGRAAAGRDSRASPAGAGEENSAAGAAGAAAAAGRAAGRGPGVGAPPGRAAAGAAGADGAAAAGVGRGPGVAVGRGPGVGAPGLGAAAPAPPAGWGAAGFRGPGFAEEPPAGGVAPKASVNLRTTGASIVEDAERTNSPSSVSLAMTALLSKPSSLASSYTRTLATSLLSIRPGSSSAGLSLLHGRTHRVLIECSSQSRPTSISRGT